MVNVNDFFPLYTKSQFSKEEKELIDLNTLSSALVVNLPLRYIFQYALNHLQGLDKGSSLSTPEKQNRTVLVVTGSRARLQEWMCHEEQVYEALEINQQSQLQNQEGGQGKANPTLETRQEDSEECSKNPWIHLFPPKSNALDEFTSATQTQTQTQSQLTLSQMRLESQGQGTGANENGSGSNGEGEPIYNDIFQPELWSRIQFRYAPSVHHIRSLFRCLHLDSETTQGRTFGHDRGGYSPTVHGVSVEEHDLQSMPTLVLLIGCFLGLDYTSSTLSSSSICILPSHLNDQKVSTGTSMLDSGTASGLRPYEAQQQTPQLSFQSYHSMAQAPSHLPRVDGLDRERVQYIKDVSGAISEIKDSLQWIERVSGKNVGLMIFENTKDPKSSLNRNMYGLLDSKLPSPQELWLQKVVGFWVDAVMLVQHQSSLQSENRSLNLEGVSGEGKVLASKEIMSKNSFKDSFCMWVKIQQSSQKMVNDEYDHEAKSEEMKVLSMGAVVGLKWDYDTTSNCFVFHVVSKNNK